MLYTSGTTGRPKGVNRTDNQRISRRAMPSTGYVPGESLHLCTGPLYHAAPLSFSLAGAAAVRRGRRADGRLVGARDPATDRRAPRHPQHMVPTMFHRLLALPDAEREAADVSSLRMVMHGAAPCPVAVKQAMIDWLGPIVLRVLRRHRGRRHVRRPATRG